MEEMVHVLIQGTLAAFSWNYSEINENLSVQFEPRLRLEVGTSQIQVRSVTASFTVYAHLQCNKYARNKSRKCRLVC
jgi:hypothetical protein